MNNISSHVPFTIKNCEVSSSYTEEHKEEIAEKFLEENHIYFTRNIQKLNIQSQKTLTKLAVLHAEKDLFALLESIEVYNIDFNSDMGIKALEEIITIASKNESLWTFSKNFQKFNIQSQTAIIQLAKKIAEKDVYSLCKYIKNYGINFNTDEGEEALEEITDIALKRTYATALLENIHKFNIQSQTALIQLAKKIAEKNLRGLCENIKNFKIDFDTNEGKEAIKEITDIALKNRKERFLGSFLRNLDKFNIQTQKTLIQIAKKYADKNLRELCVNIKNFGIDFNNEKGQIALEEILAMVLKEENESYIDLFSKNIQTFNIHSQKMRIQLAKKIAEKNLNVLCKNIDSFGIDFNTTKGQKVLQELISIILKERSTQSFLENISKFKITSQNELIKIFKMILKQEPIKNVLPLMQNCFFENDISLEKAFSIFQKTCKEDLSLPLTFITWVNDSYNSIAKEHDKRKFLKWSLLISIFSSLNTQTGCVIQNIPLLSSIRKTPPWLKDLLTIELLNFYENFNESKSDLLQMFRNACKEEKKRKTTNEIPIHTEVPALIFARYPSETKQACLKALNKIKNERSLLREEKNKKIIFDTLLKIKDSCLSYHIISHVIEELFHLNGENLLEGCKLVRNLISFKETTYFQNLGANGVTENGLIKDLENHLNVFFKKMFNCNVQNFGEKYAQTFGSWRSIDSLITFAGKMHSLHADKRKMALQLLQKFVTNVLNNNFQKTRYETEDNPHLMLVKNGDRKIFEKWKENLNLEHQEIIRDTKEKNSKIAALKNEILVRLSTNLLEKSQLYPHLEHFLKDSSQSNLLIENIQQKMTSLDEKRKTSDNQIMSKEDLISKKRLSIEKSILEFLSMNFLEDEGNLLIKSLKALINKLPRDNTFRKDLISCMQLAICKSSDDKDLVVIESDHPNDILLSGTEVDGSCLNVNGSAYDMICLFGYAFDGKHKFLLIKDTYGKILARAVLRVLVDENDKPVLFLEKMYASSSNPLYSTNLRKLALKKAHDLGIPLLSAEWYTSHSKPFHSAIFAKEKPVSFEYVDALSGIQEGPYAISSMDGLVEEI